MLEELESYEDIVEQYKDKEKIDFTRIPKKKDLKPIVTNVDRGFRISKGLEGNHIAIWHSHGWYYNHKLKRWMWQRARLFTAVEDLGPFTFTVPYLVPMLVPEKGYYLKIHI